MPYSDTHSPADRFPWEVPETEEYIEGEWPDLLEAREYTEGEWPGLPETEEYIEGEWPDLPEEGEPATERRPAEPVREPESSDASGEDFFSWEPDDGASREPDEEETWELDPEAIWEPEEEEPREQPVPSAPEPPRTVSDSPAYRSAPADEEAEEPDWLGRRPLLTRKGRLAVSDWAVSDRFVYNKERLRWPKRRKEWEIYRLSNPRFALEITYGHLAYASLTSVSLVDFATGESFRSGKRRLLPGDSLDLDFSAGEPHSLKYEDEELFLSISFDGRFRRILVRSDRFDVDLSCHEAGDAIVTAAPFALGGEFAYSCKKTFSDLAGHLHMHNVDYRLDADTFLTLWSCRGIFPVQGSWLWTWGARDTREGMLALNLGSGLGDADGPTENAVFLNGRAQKLGQVFYQFDAQDYARPWRVSDDRRRLRLEFRPEHTHAEELRLLIAHSQRHQVYGRLYGAVKLEDGRVLPIEDMWACCEHAVNHW